MRKLRFLFSVILLFCAAQLSAQQNYQLMLQSGIVETESNLEHHIDKGKPSNDEIFDGYYYRFIQFESMPTNEQKKELMQVGVILMEYIPYSAFISAIPTDFDRSLLRNYNVRSLIKQSPVQKISGRLLSEIPDYTKTSDGRIDIRIQYFKNIPINTAIEQAQKFGSVMNSDEVARVIYLRVNEDAISQISSQSWVFFIDAIAQPSKPDDTKGRSLHRSNCINSDLPIGRHYDGSGVVAALADDGFVGPHIDFTGRLTNHTFSTGSTHGDMTSGILAGAGNLDPSIRGMANGAYLHVFDIGAYTQIVDAVYNNVTYGTVVSSTSYSQGCNEYTTDTQFGDQTTRDNPQLLFVFSAGNNQSGDCSYGAGAGWGNITGGYKQGKNVIACANLDALEVLSSSSSRGPASDGRIKPDISSNGVDQLSTDENNTYQVGGGTSAACPGIAGISTQLIQAYKELNSAADAPTALIKACLLNSAEDIGNPGPDYTYGWGRVNALRAVETLEDNRYLAASISQGGTNTHNVIVPANVAQLRVMIYWHDEGGSPVATISLVNDLDMQITDPSLAVWNPWVLDPTPIVANLTTPAVRNPDHLNNVEQITLDNPAAGTYVVSVNGYSVPSGPQEYYFIYEFRTDEITVAYPIGGEGFVPGETEIIRWDALKGLGTFTLDYSTDDGTSWNLISNSISQNDLQYSWVVPNNLTGGARIRVTRGSVSGTSPEKFAIIGTPSGINVDWACPDSIHVVWNAVTGAAWYEVSMLGTEYMDSIGTSVSTDFIATGINPYNPNWFSVRAVFANGSKGRRAIAVYKTPGTFNCPLDLDVNLNTILSPGGGMAQACQGLTAVPVIIEISNAGIDSVSNIPVHYRLNGGSIISDVYVGTLQPFQTDTFTFPSPINLSSAGLYTLDAWADYPGDQNHFNDSLQNVTTVIGGSVSLIPFVENFETFSNCAVTSDCEATSCALFNGWINETNIVQDDIDFRTNQGTTPSTNTGPSADHTTGNTTGKYVYLEASGGCDTKVANLISPCIDLTTATEPQLIFWYHMYGTDMGSLHIDINNNGTWINDVITPINGNHGNAWVQVSVSLLPYIGQVINVRFRGITGTGYASDLALDDINILETNSPPGAQFSVSSTGGCVGKTFTLNDMSLNAPSSWLWTITPSTVQYVNATSSTSQNPQVQFTAAGSYDITLLATNTFGSGSTTHSNEIIISSATIIPLTEDFESSFPPAGWSVIPASGGSYTWEQSSSITGSSGNPTVAAFVNNYSYDNPGGEDGLESLEFNIQNASLPVLTFDVSYARYSATYSDSLRVDISDDCGATYVPTGYLKGGTSLATSGDQTSQWSPTSSSHWRTDTVNLSPWIGSNVLVKFVNINGYGNFLYLDNINLLDLLSGIEGSPDNTAVSIYPNPSSGIFNLTINSDVDRDFIIEIVDMNGRLITSNSIVTSGLHHTIIDLSTLSRGVYSIILKGENTFYRNRIVIM